MKITEACRFDYFTVELQLCLSKICHYCCLSVLAAIFSAGFDLNVNYAGLRDKFYAFVTCFGNWEFHLVSFVMVLKTCCHYS